MDFGLPSSTEKEKALVHIAQLLDNLLSKKKFSKKDSIIVLDVGCGFLKYRDVLIATLKKHVAEEVRLIAIDKIWLFKFRDYAPAEFLNCDVRSCSRKLKKIGVKEIDIVSVFNPFPGIPDLSDVRQFYNKDTFLIGCVDWNKELFLDSLHKNGFIEKHWQENIYWEETRVLMNSYDPFVLAFQ